MGFSNMVEICTQDWLENWAEYHHKCHNITSSSNEVSGDSNHSEECFGHKPKLEKELKKIKISQIKAKVDGVLNILNWECIEIVSVLKCRIFSLSHE